MTEQYINQVTGGGVTKRSYKKLFLVITVLLLISTAAGYAAWRLIDKPGEVHTQRYSNLEEYALTGTQNNVKDGLSILKPKEFVPASSGQSASNSAMFIDYKDPATKKESLGSLYLASASSQPGQESDYTRYVDGQAKALNSPKDPANTLIYESYRSYYANYLKSFIPKDLDIDLSDPTPVKTTNISKNAWKFDFTAKASAKTANTQVGQPIIKGSFLIVFGERAYYYVVIQTVEYNWQSNQATWQKIIDSLKIDQ